jgi:putative ABC transport system substrate-binding protein
MNRKLLLLVTVLLLASIHSTEAQQPKVPRIGFLRSGSAASAASDREAFLQGLRDLGYVDGKNIMIEYRYAEGKAERWPVLAAELVKLNVDIFVVGGVGVTRAVHEATQMIPIVVGAAGDLVKSGLIASLAKPGGNITGSTEIATDLSGKRIELLKEIVPRASRVAVIWHSPTGLSDDDEELKQTKAEARQFGMNVLPLGIQEPDQFQNAFNTVTHNKANAIIILRSSLTLFNRKQLAELSVKNRLLSICDGEDFVRDGCLISYGAEQGYLWRRAANFVDKILKGTKPAELPVEQPTKFELIINLKAAKQIGLIIPPNVLARADKVIRCRLLP